MKTSNNRILPYKYLLILFNFITFCNLSNAADLGLNPSILKLKVYKFAVSASVFCTNPITVVDNGNTPTEVDFVGGVSLGSGSIPINTYPCVIIEFASIIKFKPDAVSTSGNCNPAAAVVEMDVCRNGGSSVLTDGTTTNCTTNNPDRIALYLSTTSTGTVGGPADALNPPTVLNDATKGFNLGNPLIVTGTSTGTFIVNGTGKVCDGDDAGCDGGGNNGLCRLEPPLFDFDN